MADQIRQLLKALDIAERYVALQNAPWSPMVQKEDLAEVRAALSTPPAATPAARDWSALDKLIDEYVEDYEMIAEDEQGREGCYTPSEHERHMIRDAIAGLLADREFMTALARPAPAAAPAMRDELMKLSQFAHTAAHMSEKDMRNNLADIADQLIALATKFIRSSK